MYIFDVDMLKYTIEKGRSHFPVSDDYLTFNKNLKFVMLYFVIL